MSDNLATALDLQEQSEAAFEEGADADETGDHFELAAILLAVTLFFGGIATLFGPRGSRSGCWSCRESAWSPAPWFLLEHSERLQSFPNETTILTARAG